MLLQAHRAGIRLAKKRLLESPIYNLVIPDVILSYPPTASSTLRGKHHSITNFKNQYNHDVAQSPFSSRYSWLKKWSNNLGTSRIALPNPPKGMFNPDPNIVNSSISLTALLEAGNKSGCQLDGRDTLAPIHDEFNLAFQGWTTGILYNFLEFVFMYRMADQSPSNTTGWW
jgi:hypothetical protein